MSIVSGAVAGLKLYASLNAASRAGVLSLSSCHYRRANRRIYNTDMYAMNVGVG